MTLKFIDLYNECAGQPWSMFDNDANSVEDFETAMKISINKAISYLWNLQPWSFKLRTKNIRTKENKTTYTMPNGMLQKKVVGGTTRYGIKFGDNFLDYLPNYEVLDEREGSPEGFYVENDNLYIYPVPDGLYDLTVRYMLLPFGLDEEGNEINELSEDEDYINIPEKYEVLFKNCLISLAMIYVIADESDENHSGYTKQYEDALKILTKFCKNNIIEQRIFW